MSWSALVSFRGARYSVPDRLAATGVWVPATGDEVVIVSGEGSGAEEVARHKMVAAGQVSIADEHYPNHRHRDPMHRAPKATNTAEADFLELGEGAKLYLVEADAAGVRRVETRMAEAVVLSVLHGKDVDRALGTAAIVGRFSDGDLESILVHAEGAVRGPAVPPAEHSLSAGTAGWSGLGQRPADAEEEDER